MSISKWRWLLFTVLIGLVPILVRILLSILVEGEKKVPSLSPADFIAFGIVLHVSMFSEMKYYEVSDSVYKHAVVAVSTVFILFYGFLYAMALLSEVAGFINVNYVLDISVLLAIISFLICYSLFERVIAVRVSMEGKK